MIINVLDKLIFGGLLVFMFQVPIIANHYLQFISGYYEATKAQVEGYKANARRHEYPNVYAMVDELLANPNPVIRTDAQQKIHTLREYEELKKAVTVLQNGNFLVRAWFIFNPSRRAALKKVLANYRPGIPLSPGDVLLSVLLALGLSIVVMWPVRLVTRSK